MSGRRVRAMEDQRVPLRERHRASVGPQEAQRIQRAALAVLTSIRRCRAIRWIYSMRVLILPLPPRSQPARPRPIPLQGRRRVPRGEPGSIRRRCRICTRTTSTACCSSRSSLRLSPGRTDRSQHRSRAAASADGKEWTIGSAQHLHRRSRSESSVADRGRLRVFLERIVDPRPVAAPEPSTARSWGWTRWSRRPGQQANSTMTRRSKGCRSSIASRASSSTIRGRPVASLTESDRRRRARGHRSVR